MAQAPRPVEARRPRSDAIRNRGLILEAAAEVFAAHGERVDVREIARRAGVGMGTLYRHFPTKEELLDTVLQQDFLSWTREARDAAAAEPDPGTALSDFLRDSLDRQVDHRGLTEGFAGCWGPNSGAAVCRRELHPVIDTLVERCREAGVLRQGVSADDVSALLIGLGAIVQLAAAQGRPELLRRALDVVLAGLFATDEC